MKVIGLTGGIASGKSTVSRFLAQLGAEIIDADILARQVVQPGEKAYTKIVQTFGSIILLDDKNIDRKALANVVFASPEKLQKLNAIIHPEVIDRTKKILQEMKQAGKKVSVIDAPLLIEAGMTFLADEVWLVSVKPEIQLERATSRDKMTNADAKARIAAQMSLVEKENYVDRIIDNSHTPMETYEVVKRNYKEFISE